MFIHDALPRAVDLQRTLGVDAREIAEESTKELLELHPHLRAMPSEQEAKSLNEYAAQHLEYLALALDERDPDLFGDYLGWVSRLLVARGFSKAYLAEHLEILKDLLRWRLEGRRADQVTALIDDALRAFWVPRSGDVPYPQDEGMHAVREALLAALLQGDREQAVAAVDAGFRSGLKVLDAYLGVLQPVMYEIGVLWERAEITVAQEHVATALMQSVLAHCALRFRSAPPRRAETVALTGVQGELHELGLRVVSDVLEANGWKTLLLGTNLPALTVARLLAPAPPLAIGVSVTMAHNLDAARQLIQHLRAHPALRESTVVVGGAALRACVDVPHPLGADACVPDVEAFLHLLNTLALRGRRIHRAP